MSRMRPTPSEFVASAYDPVLESEFFARIVLPNGSVKTTARNRLDDLNVFCLEHMRDLCASYPAPIKILDVAASSAVSTVEWREYLVSQSLPVSMFASDMTAEAIHVHVGCCEGLMDDRRHFIHLSWRGRGMPPKAKLPFALITGSLKGYLRCRLILGAAYTPIRLATKFPGAERIVMVNDDLRTTKDTSLMGCHVVRAANILNKAYFDEATLARMLDVLKARLVDRGLLVVCRTDGDVNNGTIFRLRGGEFVPLARLRAGSEVEDIVARLCKHRD